MARLISDGGTMTVGRRTASYTWGQFQVTLQEGLEQAKNLSDRMADGYIYRPDDAGKGRAELTFVRADARIDMNADKSDLEATLDGASRRTEGEVFYSREITGLGLARTNPGRDYDVGDLVEVLVWGKYLSLPVTAITLGDAPDDVRVQVGGQMLRDAEASRKRNSAIDVQIATEKRQRLKEAGALKKATAAAQSTADAAVEDAAQLRDVLGGTGAADTTLTAQLAAINAQIQSQGGQPQPGLLLMYIQMNTQLWEQQQRVDALQDQLLHELQDAIAATKQEQADLAERRAETILATRAGSSHPDFPVLLRGDQWGLGGMFSTGDAVRVSQWERGADGALTAPVEKFVLVASAGTVPEVQGLTASSFLEVSRMTTPLEVRRFTYRLPNVAYGDKSKLRALTGMDVTVPKGTRSLDVSARVMWSSGWGWYTMQIVRSDGTILAERKDQGASTIFVSKPLEQTLTVSGAEVPAGQSVMVRVQSGDRNEIMAASWSGSWTQSKS